MACEKCGHSGCYSWHSCPICSKNVHEAPRNVQQHVDAGHNFVEGIFKIIMAFFLHPVLCLVPAGLVGFFGMMWAAPLLGVVEPAAGPFKNPGAAVDTYWEIVPMWYRVIAIVVPGAVAIALRKYVRPVMKWIFIIGLTGLAVWAVVAMVIQLNNR